jgi:hypothetical protein
MRLESFWVAGGPGFEVEIGVPFVLIEGHPKFGILTQGGRTGVVLDCGAETILWNAKGRPTRPTFFVA